jgi:hypothetical protein
MEFKVNAIKEVRHSMFKNGTKVGTMIRMLKSGRFAKRRPKSPSITWVRARAPTAPWIG